MKPAEHKETASVDSTVADAAYTDAVYTDAVWQTEELAQTFLEGVRGAIPLAQEQIAVMLRLILMAGNDIERFLDLGCGDGVLGQAIYGHYPASQGVFVDFSEPMLAAARKRLGAFERSQILRYDYGDPAWTAAVAAYGPFDAIVSGYSIHHQPDARKQALYAELYELLKPGGIFLNIEHVASPTPWAEQVFNEHFIDSLAAYHQRSGSEKTRAEVARSFYARPDKAANQLAPLELQLLWLRQIGFSNVDCYFKIFELAIFGGTRPLLT